MNPEFERNLWLELTPGRMLVMAVVLALAFFAAALTGGMLAWPGEVARLGWYVIVVVWGARNAALSVVGEIRAHTWDGQRLSSLGAGTMMWGKLLGSTIYNWFGGVLCLAVILADLMRTHGIAIAAVELVYYLAIGVIAQAAALLASLIAAGRRRGRTQFEVFLYQAAGLLAAAAVFYVWALADPVRSTLLHVDRQSVVMWWTQACPAQGFLLASLALFAGWTLTGCWRRMRLELKMRNGPLVWLGFLFFCGFYVAGFDAWLASSGAFAHLGPAALRLAQAGMVFAVLAYTMVLLEAKDRVLYRWLGSAFAQGRIGKAFASLQGWMMAYLAAFLVGIGLIFWLENATDRAGAAAMLGLLTRDMGLVVAAGVLIRRRSGDFTALALLFLLYVLLPAIFGSLHLAQGMALFLPYPTTPVWLSPLIAWGEACVVWVTAVAAIALPEERTKPA